MARASSRIVLTTFGSFGDLHPYIAIALALQQRGRDVAIGTSAFYEAKLGALGIPFIPIRPDYSDPAKQQEIIRKIFDLRKGPEYVFRELFMPVLRQSYEDLDAAAEGVRLFVSHPLTLMTPLVAEKRGILWASSVLAPMGFVSVYDPPAPPAAPYLVHLRLFFGPWFFRLLLGYMKKSFDPWVEPWHALRAELGLGPAPNPVFEGQHSPHLVLALFSHFLGEPQPDWPPNTCQTGFPSFDQDGETHLLPELNRFLESGPEPIVFTLGSSAVMDAGSFFEESLKAAKQLGRRAIALLGRNAPPLPPDLLGKDVFVADYAPFSALFPRAAAIVHQGGVGTTGQGLRSGRPVLIMPCGVDQPDNAERMRRLGIARIITRRSYRADRAARELKRLLEDPTYARRATEIGVQAQAEEGATVAAEALIALLRKHETRV
jgi:UDP:flavonoid glycosyltransferase YjiC (YdhE family)